MRLTVSCAFQTFWRNFGDRLCVTLRSDSDFETSAYEMGASQNVDLLFHLDVSYEQPVSLDLHRRRETAMEGKPQKSGTVRIEMASDCHGC